jgi:hypothetical protein
MRQVCISSSGTWRSEGIGLPSLSTAAFCVEVSVNSCVSAETQKCDGNGDGGNKGGNARPVGSDFGASASACSGSKVDGTVVGERRSAMTSGLE